MRVCRSGMSRRGRRGIGRDRKSTRLNSSHTVNSYAVFCLKKKKDDHHHRQKIKKSFISEVESHDGQSRPHVRRLSLGCRHLTSGQLGLCCVFFFDDTATTEIYTLSLHDALPISRAGSPRKRSTVFTKKLTSNGIAIRSEEHTSELQSHSDIVCRLLLEKKKKAKERVAVLDRLLTQFSADIAREQQQTSDA